MAQPAAGEGLIWEARLVHAEPERRVVEVAAWRDGQCLGRSLGEAEEAEAAEDRAIRRLQQRLNGASVDGITQAVLSTAPAVDPPARRAQPPIRHSTADTAPPTASQARQQPEPAQPAQPASTKRTEGAPTAVRQPTLGEPQDVGDAHAPEPPPHDPDDWSDELAEIDVQLQRLGWDRNQEGMYLQRAFAHPSRSRLTSYTDLSSYLRSLRELPAGCNPDQAAVPLRRRDLLEQSDALLSSLGWDPQRGRTLLEQHFQKSSRQQLSDEQLLHFNMLLEEELLAGGEIARKQS